MPSDEGAPSRSRLPLAAFRDPRRLVPNSEYARLIGVTPRTIWNMEKQGRLKPPLVINGRKYRDPNELPAADASAEVVEYQKPSLPVTTADFIAEARSTQGFAEKSPVRRTSNQTFCPEKANALPALDLGRPRPEPAMESVLPKAAVRAAVVFTNTWLERLRPARQWYTETGRPGFMLRTFPSGEKSFVYRYQMSGKRRVMTLGAYPAVGLAEAHRRYEAAQCQVREGSDPIENRRTAEVVLSAAPTVADIVNEWQNLYAAAHRKRPDEARALLSSNLPASFLEMKAKDVTKRIAIDLVLDPILKRGARAVSTDVGNLLKQIFAYAEDRERIPASLLSTLKKHGGKEERRKRWLTDEEIVKFWHGLDRCGMHEFMRVALRLTLVTAQRRGEIATMRWSHIDFGTKVWTIPDPIAKNGAAHMVPLSTLALQLLAQLKFFAKDSEFVLPSYHSKTKSSQSLTERALTRAIRDNETVFGIPHFTPHDLRRTARTNFSRLRVPTQVAELILNHRKQGMVEVYDQWEHLDEKAEALNKWASHIEKIVGLVGSKA